MYILVALAFCGGCALGFVVGIRTSQAERQKLERKLKQMDTKIRKGKSSQPIGGTPQRENPFRSQTSSSDNTDGLNTEGPGRNVSGTGQAGTFAGRMDGNQERTPMTRDQWYQKFGQVDTLAIHFNYSFPDKMYFQAGTGYIRNARNQLVPEKDVFSKVNTATGYAMEGLFWVFNITYQGREYTFHQIMEGKMATGYVRVEGIPVLAKVESTGVDGCYRLVQKGKLKIVDV